MVAGGRPQPRSAVQRVGPAPDARARRARVCAHRDSASQRGHNPRLSTLPVKCSMRRHVGRQQPCASQGASCARPTCSASALTAAALAVSASSSFSHSFVSPSPTFFSSSSLANISSDFTARGGGVARGAHQAGSLEPTCDAPRCRRAPSPPSPRCAGRRTRLALGSLGLVARR
eukprot:scaffold21122_cov107-Isochrysis_galbana.AAC.2